MRPFPRHAAFVALLVLPSFTACLPYTVGSSAQTVPANESTHTGTFYFVPNAVKSPDDSIGVPMAGMDYEWRHGIDARSDFGVRMLPGGATTNYKRRIGADMVVAASLAANDYSLNAIWPAKHPTSKICMAFREQTADLRRTYPLAAKLHFRHLVSEKTKLRAQLSKQLDISAAVLPESETFTQVNFPCMKTIANDIRQKFFSRNGRKVLIKTNNDRLLDAKHFEIGQALVEGLKHWWS